MTYDSIYPEFFKAGVNKLQQRGAANGDFLGLFSALEQFRCDIADQRDVQAILQVTEPYLFGLDLFDSIGFYLINPANFDFELAHCAPPEQADRLDRLVRQEIRAGRFAWALRQNRPVFFQGPAEPSNGRGVFHTLSVASRRLGMFCGQLKLERAPSQEVTFNLLSLLLGASSDALAVARTTEDLENQVLAANQRLQRALKENEVLARLPAENPNPVLRLNQSGQVLYANPKGTEVLRALDFQVGDLISGAWLDRLGKAFGDRTKYEFEAAVGGRTYVFLIVPVPEAGYANFYGVDITSRKTAEAERETLIRQLQDALAKVKTLSGLVPICAWCKKIRDDRGFWNQVEVYIQNHSDAVFTHGVCPDCVKRLTREFNPAREKA